MTSLKTPLRAAMASCGVGVSVDVRAPLQEQTRGFGDCSLGTLIVQGQRFQGSPESPENHRARSVSASSGLGGVWTKAASTAAARQAPEPTRSATRGPLAEMIHPVRMLPMGVVPK